MYCEFSQGHSFCLSQALEGTYADIAHFGQEDGQQFYKKNKKFIVRLKYSRLISTQIQFITAL